MDALDNPTALHPYDRGFYGARHPIESFSCELEQYRAIATHYAETARNLLAAVYLAGIAILLDGYDPSASAWR